MRVSTGSSQLLFACVFALAATLGSCGPTDPLLDQCLKLIPSNNGTPLVIPVEENTSTNRAGLNVASKTLWPHGDIRVCYETETYDSRRQLELELVRAAADTWSEQLTDAAQQYGLLATRFVGFEPCTAETELTSLRIRIEDSVDNPHVKDLGRRLKGLKDGMVLNFDFRNWSPDCSKSDVFRYICVGAVALHEFGHALGFAHEQNRSDTPPTCTDAPQGTDGDFYYGSWDRDSVMNYCNPRWNNDAQLSGGDKLWARATYYPETIDDKFCDGLSAREHGVPSPPEETP